MGYGWVVGRREQGQFWWPIGGEPIAIVTECDEWWCVGVQLVEEVTPRSELHITGVVQTDGHGEMGWRQTQTVSERSPPDGE